MGDDVAAITHGPTTWKWSHVACRTCGAEIGKPCITLVSGKVTSAHVHRRADWYEAAQRWRDGVR